MSTIALNSAQIHFVHRGPSIAHHIVHYKYFVLNEVESIRDACNAKITRPIYHPRWHYTYSAPGGEGNRYAKSLYILIVI